MHLAEARCFFYAIYDKHFDLNLLISKGGSTAIIAEKYYDGN